MCKNAERWLFALSTDYIWESGLVSPEDLGFRDKTGVLRLVVRKSGKVTVPSSYAWDGCSPKGCLFDFVVGTPDGVVDTGTKRPKTYYASLVHDAMYQFLLDGLSQLEAHARTG